MSRVVCLVSGGLDSAVMLLCCLKEFDRVVAVSVDYGQASRTEVPLAEALCAKLGVPHRIVSMSGLFRDGIASGGTFSSFSEAVVPRRNYVLIEIAAVVAAQEGAGAVYIGVNADDQEDFEDCRPNNMPSIEGVSVVLPLVGRTKKEIFRMAKDLGLKDGDTVSCYLGTRCGACAACKLREGSREI